MNLIKFTLMITAYLFTAKKQVISTSTDIDTAPAKVSSSQNSNY